MVKGKRGGGKPNRGGKGNNGENDATAVRNNVYTIAWVEAIKRSPLLWPYADLKYSRS